MDICCKSVARQILKKGGMLKFIAFLLGLIPMPFFGWLWMSLGLILLAGEMLLPGLFFCVSLALGACAASLAAFLSASVPMQCTYAITASCLSMLASRWWGISLMQKKQLKTNTEALIGHYAIVTQEIAPAKSGRVKFRGEEWPARIRQRIVASPGESVHIIGIEGNHLVGVI